MKNLNNFDLSSNGVSIELDVCFDCDLARFWFDETFCVLQHSGYRQNSILVYGAHFADVSDFDISDKENYNLKKTTVKKLRKYLRDELGYEYRDLMDMRKDDLLSELHSYCPEDFADTLVGELDATPNFATVESRGYSQGDYSEVIIPASVLSEFPNQTLETIGEFLSDEIDRLLWDAPIRCNVSVDEVDVTLSHLLPDCYDWDKQTSIDVFKLGMDKSLSKKQYKTLISFLRENLPETLDYSH